MHGPDQYLFITPVWGEAYVERFVKLCLPAQLSAGNLGSVPKDRGLFLIYTRGEFARTITRSPAYRKLKSMMPTAVKSLDDLPDPRFNKNPHELQTAAYLRGLRAGAGKETAFVFLTPDILVGDGTYRNMVRLAEAGQRVHLLAGIRMLSEGAVACVTQHRGTGPADVAIPCRSLVRFCLDNPHPLARGHMVNDGKVLAAEHLYWKVGDHGLLARGFHLHPLLVWPRDPNAVIRNTLDDEYVSRACPDRADWHAVVDSDEMCVVEFSDRGHKTNMLAPEPMSDRALAKFLHDHTSPDHREHVLNRLFFHTQGVVPQDWTAAEAESDAMVDRCLKLFDTNIDEVPDAAPVAPPPPSWKKRTARLLSLPWRAAYRLLNRRLYNYADRLNAMVQSQQFQIEQQGRQVANLSQLVEALLERVERLEQRDGARSAQDAAMRRRKAG
jgi:hypothetical protein